MISWLRQFLGGRILPPWEWLWAPYDEGRSWWRGHFVAHTGHGAFFCLCAWLFDPTANFWFGGVFLGFLWEAFQREYWRNYRGSTMALWSNLWDFVFATLGSTLAYLLLTLF